LELGGLLRAAARRQAEVAVALAAEVGLRVQAEQAKAAEGARQRLRVEEPREKSRPRQHVGMQKASASRGATQKARPRQHFGRQRWAGGSTWRLGGLLRGAARRQAGVAVALTAEAGRRVQADRPRLQ